MLVILTLLSQGTLHNTWPVHSLFSKLKWVSHGISALTLTKVAMVS